MNISPVRIFMNSDSIDSFRRDIRLLDGDFFFETLDMLQLGQAYFDRYPDSYHHRKTSEVLMGYELARICILEKAAVACDAKAKACFREIVKDVSLVERVVCGCIDERGYDRAYGIYESIMKEINIIKFSIEQLPLGMVKERFIGGLTIFYNLSYIVKASFIKNRENSAGG